MPAREPRARRRSARRAPRRSGGARRLLEAAQQAFAFDGLGRLLSQSGYLGAESVNRSYTYDGLSRLKTAVGPWEKSTGSSATVTWQYAYDALGNLRSQSSNRTPTYLADSRTWSYAHTSKPHFLSHFQQQGQPTEQLSATPGGEVSLIDRGPVFATESLVWNAQGKLHQFENSTYSYDAFDELVLTVTGPSGATSSIVHVGDDFEYDLGAAGRANKTFKLGGVTIASLATNYTATTASSLPAVYRRSLRRLEPLAAPALGLALLVGVAGLASLTTRRRTPLWLAAPAMGLLSTTLVLLPSTAYAATTLTIGPGKYGRHAEPIVAYLPDHLGTTRAVVNHDGIAIETRDYAPFGESIAHAGAFAVQHRFTGQPQDDQAGGLYNYGARFYNARWGRFVSPDEVVQSFDSQGLNPFTYVLNRPTSAIDPNGETFSIPSLSLGTLGGLAGGFGTSSGGGAFAGAGGPSPKICDDYGRCILDTPVTSYGQLGTGVLPPLNIGPEVDVDIMPGPPGPGEDATSLFLFGLYVIGIGIAFSKATEQNSGEEAQSERDKNVEASEAKGIPKDRLGPSGKPKVHNPRFPTRKAAKDAARQAGKGEPIPHSPPGGTPHFHPVDAAGKKIPGQHFGY